MSEVAGDRPSQRSARLSGEAGVTSTEVAIVMPIVLVLIMLIFQVGLFWHAKQSADVAAEEAVEAAQLADATEQDGVAGAEAILDQAGNLRDARISVDRNAATGTVTVTVSGAAPAIVPFGSWRVEAQAQGSIERFIPAGER